ncbi:MAG: hypothetical protein ACLFQM_08475 [Fidelibacterota bacterium]
MKPVQVTKWPTDQCDIHQENFDHIFAPLNDSGKQFFIKPFIAIQTEEQAKILIDAARFNYYKTQKIQDIPVYFLAADSTFFELLAAATDYFLYDHTLNNRIIARILDILDTTSVDRPTYTAFVSQKLKISPRKTVTEKYRAFNRIITPISDYLIIKKAPLKAWEYIAMSSTDDQQFYAQLIADLKPSLSNLLEFIENLTEINKLNAQNFAILKKELLTILEQYEEKNILYQIRHKIQEFRYPHLTKHRDKINELFAELDRPEQVNLQYDRSFEKKEITGFFRINRTKDIDAIANFFKEKNCKTLQNIIKKL